MKRVAVIAVLATLTTGCNAQTPGAGVSGGRESSSTEERTRTITKQKQMQNSTAARATATMPAMALIAGVLGLHDRDTQGYKDAMLTGRRFELDSKEDALTVIAAAVQPLVGWEVDPIPEFSDLPRREALALRERYLRALEAAALLANGLLEELAAKVAERPRRDPDVAAAEIRKACEKIPMARVQALWAQALDQAAGKRVVDLSGRAGAGVHWLNTRLGADFACQAGGCQVTLNGVQWFGGGKLSGNEYTIALESASSSSITNLQSMDRRQAGTAVSRQGAQTGVGR